MLERCTAITGAPSLRNLLEKSFIAEALETSKFFEILSTAVTSTSCKTKSSRLFQICL